MGFGVLFDLDGTLLDTLGDLHASVNATLAEFGLPAKSLQQVRAAVGHGVRHLLETVSAGSGVEVQKLLDVYLPYYRAHCLDTTAPYPGIPEMLTQLQARFPVGVVSNKSDEQTKSICARFFPGVYALGQREGVPVKPAPDMVYTAMQSLGITQCVYIGDGDTDVQVAKNAGLPCLSVLWGFRDREQLEAVGATNFCQTADDILKWMETYGK